MLIERKITVSQVLQEGLSIGLMNAASVLGAVVLWVLTIWVPYINVGTTIAISAMPIELGKGRVISPTYIFDEKYRKYMGEYFNLIGLMAMSLIPAFLFMVVPYIIISIGWSLSLFLLIDKGVSPSEAMVMSNKYTYGYKGDIFLIELLKGVAFTILFWILVILMMAINAFLGFIIALVLVVVYQSYTIGCYAVIYRDLVGETESEEEPQIEEL